MLAVDAVVETFERNVETGYNSRGNRTGSFYSTGLVLLMFKPWKVLGSLIKTYTIV